MAWLEYVKNGERFTIELLRDREYYIGRDLSCGNYLARCVVHKHLLRALRIERGKLFNGDLCIVLEDLGQLCDTARLVRLDAYIDILKLGNIFFKGLMSVPEKKNICFAL